MLQKLLRVDWRLTRFFFTTCSGYGRLMGDWFSKSSNSPQLLLVLSRVKTDTLRHLGNSSWVSSSLEALLNSQMTTSRITFRYFWYVLHMLNHLYHILCTRLHSVCFESRCNGCVQSIYIYPMLPYIYIPSREWIHIPSKIRHI